MNILIFLLVGILCSVFGRWNPVHLYLLVAKVALLVVVFNGVNRLRAGEGKRLGMVSASLASSIALTVIELSAYSVLFFAFFYADGLSLWALILVAIGLSTPSPAVVLPLLARYESLCARFRSSINLVRMQLISSNVFVIVAFYLLSSLAFGSHYIYVASMSLTIVLPIALVAVAWLLRLADSSVFFAVSIIATQFLFESAAHHIDLSFYSSISCFVYILTWRIFFSGFPLPVVRVLDKSWLAVKPMLFFLMGLSVNWSMFQSLRPVQVVIISLIIVSGVALRVLVSYVIQKSLLCLSEDEILTAWANIPKATVQAGLASFFLLPNYLEAFGIFSCSIAYVSMLLSVATTVGIGSHLVVRRLGKLSQV